MAAVEFGGVNKLNELFQDPGYPISAGQLPPNQAIVMIEVDQTRMFGGAKFENGHADEILLPGAKDRDLCAILEKDKDRTQKTR